MKKLLTILTLALALCMLCGIALADDSHMERDELNYPSRVHDILNEGVYQIIEIKINTEPTCTAYGTATVKCNNPAHKDYFHLITIEKLPHVFQNVDPAEYNTEEDGYGYAPTAAEVEDDTFRCINDIYQKQECAVCHEEAWVLISSAYSPTYSHEYVMGKVLPGDEGDCMNPRIKTAYCKYCGDIDYSWWEDLGRQDHKFTIKVYDTITEDHKPTCLNNLAYTYVLECEVCGIFENDQWAAPSNEYEWEDGGRWVIHTATGMKPADVLANFGYEVDAAGHTWKNLNKDTVRNNQCETLYQNDVCIHCAEKRHIPIKGEEGKAAVYAYIEDLRIDCQHYYERWQCSECQGKVHDDQLVEVTIEKEEDYRHNPDWTNAYMSVNPTCEEEGEVTISCLDCGKTVTWPYPPTGHAWTAYTLAIVGDDGYDVYISVCQICNKTRELVRPNTDPADTKNGYKYVYDDDPYCTEPGYHVYRNEDTWDYVYVPFGSPLGHNWQKYDDESYDATCTDDGLLVEKCLRCSDWQAKVIPALGHDYVEVAAVEPTCVDDGNELYYTCSRCDQLFDAEKAEIAEIPVIAATGIHVADPAKDAFVAGAKCLEKTRIVRFCANCTYSWVEEDAVLPHAPVLVEGKAATCIAEGIEDYYKCSREGCEALFADAEAAEAIEAPVVIPVDPAAHGEGLKLVEAVAATCTAEGCEAYYKCDNCGKTFSDDKGTVAVDVATLAIAKTEHSYTVKVSETPATCTAEGVIVWKCATCDALKTEALAILPHELEDVAEVPATCTEAGKEAGKACKNCEYTEGFAVIPALGHDYQNVPAVDPTCTAEGKSEYRACTRCGDEQVKPSVIPALGHDLTVIEAKAATCTEDGWTAGSKCSRCSDPEVNFESKPIKATGHKWNDGEVTKEPAEGVKGETTFTCTVCGEKKTEEIPALPIPAVYDVEGIEYTKPLATGKAVLDPATDPLEKAYARVTFFLSNGDCMIQIVEVEADGTFKAGAIGNFVHISVVIIDVDDAYGADEAIEHAYGNGGKVLD